MKVSVSVAMRIVYFIIIAIALMNLSASAAM